MTNTVLGKLCTELSDYTDIQVILANQYVPESKLKRPRVMLFFTSQGSDSSPHAHIQKQKSYDEVEKTITIEQSYNSTYTLSVRLLGKEIDDFEYLEKIKTWFEIEKLGYEFFKDYEGAIIHIEPITDLSSFDNDAYLYEYNMDVFINFNKSMEFEVDSIEEVQINE